VSQELTRRGHCPDSLVVLVSSVLHGRPSVRRRPGACTSSNCRPSRAQRSPLEPSRLTQDLAAKVPQPCTSKPPSSRSRLSGVEISIARPAQGAEHARQTHGSGRRRPTPSVSRQASPTAGKAHRGPPPRPPRLERGSNAKRSSRYCASTPPPIPRIAHVLSSRPICEASLSVASRWRPSGYNMASQRSRPSSHRDAL
jgi:hypothetical protein